EHDVCDGRLRGPVQLLQALLDVEDEDHQILEAGHPVTRYAAAKDEIAEQAGRPAQLHRHAEVTTQQPDGQLAVESNSIDWPGAPQGQLRFGYRFGSRNAAK